MEWSIGKTMRILIVTAGIMALAGCAARHHARLGLEYLDVGNSEQAVTELAEAHRLKPDDLEIEMNWNRARIQAAAANASRGRERLDKGDRTGAREAFTRALDYDPLNAAANDGVRAIDTTPTPIGTPNPEKPDRAEPERISFAFQDTDLGEIIRAIGQVGGMNVLVDDSAGVNRLVTVTLDRVTPRQAIDDLALTFGLMVVQVGPEELLIAQDSQENRERFICEEVRMFTLQYADAGKIRKMLEPLMKSSVVLADEHLNAVVIRTDSSQMNMASQLIESMDARESEVMIGMEILEVSRGNLQRLGIDLGDNPLVRATIGGAVREQGQGGTLTVDDINRLDQNQLFITFPSLYLNLLKKDSGTRILAQPQLRILNRNAARFHVGEKIPLKVTTSRYRDTSEETSVYEYRDVGILLEITPNVLSNDELALDVKIEISSIVKESETGQPTIGTREIKTVLRLRHGETELIAGLLKNEERSGIAKIPIVGDIPMLGRLFSTSGSDKNQTDIVISLTPVLLDRGRRAPAEQVVWADRHGGKPAALPVRITGSDGPKESISKTKDDVRPTLPAGEESAATPMPDATGLTVVRIDPAESELARGTKKVLSVQIDAAREVAGAPFYIEFDPGVVEVVSVREGRFMSSDGKPTTFLHTIDNVRGTVVIGLSRLGGEGISGSGTLVEMEIVAAGQGRTAMRFTHASLRDSQAGELPSDFQDGMVTVR